MNNNKIFSINQWIYSFIGIFLCVQVSFADHTLETLPPELEQDAGVQRISEIQPFMQINATEINEILLLKCFSDARPNEKFNFYLLTDSEQQIVGLRLKTFEKNSGNLIDKADYNPEDLSDKVSLSWTDVGFFRIHINWIEKAPNTPFDLNHGGKLRLVVTSSHSGFSIYRKILPIEVIRQGNQWSLFANTNAGRMSIQSIFFKARYEEYNSNGEGEGDIIGIKELHLEGTGQKQVINLDHLEDH